MIDNPAFRHAMHMHYMADPYLHQVLREEAMERHAKQLVRFCKNPALKEMMPLIIAASYLSVVEYFDGGGWMDG